MQCAVIYWIRLNVSTCTESDVPNSIDLRILRREKKQDFYFSIPQKTLSHKGALLSYRL